MKLNIRILMAAGTGQNYSDITDIVEAFRLSTSIGNQAAKLEMNIIGDGAAFELGSRVQIFDGDNGIFEGWLFSVSMNNDIRFHAVCYDQTRYLRNVDTLVYKEKTLSDIFSDICSRYDLQSGTVDRSTYTIPPEVYEGKSLWDVLQECVDQTLAYEKRLFIIRDVFGRLELRDIVNLRTDFVIDDENVALGYDYSVGIDKNSFNQVKLGFEDEAASERKWGIVQNSAYIDQWGLLQKYELLKQKLTVEELDRKAQQMLDYYCRPTREVSLQCFGDFRISAGVGVNLELERVSAFKGMNRFYVTSCEHSVTCDKHVMNLRLAVDGFGG